MRRWLCIFCCCSIFCSKVGFVSHFTYIRIKTIEPWIQPFFRRLDLFYSFSFQADLSSSTRVLKRVPFLKKCWHMLLLKVSIRLARFCSIHWGYISFGWHEWSRMIACYVFCCLNIVFIEQMIHFSSGKN